MNVRRNRPGRTTAPRRVRGPKLGLLVAGICLLAAAPAPAQAAGPGGTSAFVAKKADGSDLAFSRFRTAGATWYGPGLYGNRTACGHTLRPHTVGVAHRTLPCGTAVRFLHKGRSLVARVIDRGPFVDGVAWDLTNGARRLLTFEGIGPIRYAVARGVTAR